MRLGITNKNDFPHGFRIPVVEFKSAVKGFVHCLRNISALVSADCKAVKIFCKYGNITRKIKEFYGNVFVAVAVNIIAVQKKP